MRKGLVWLALAAMTVSGASALDLPVGPPLPALPLPLGRPGETAGTALETVRRLAREALAGVRDVAGRLTEPAARAAALDTDPQGFAVRRGEILARPSADIGPLLDRMEIDIARRLRIGGAEVLVLRTPDDAPLGPLIERLRSADPAGLYDYNHIYEPSGGASAGPSAAPPPAARCEDCRIGVIDAGADLTHAAFAGRRVRDRGFGGDPLPSRHGTAVLSVLAASAPEARLYLADVFCGDSGGGSAEAIAAAFAWMADRDVPVVSISLAGPPNLILALAVAEFTARGGVVVAAVGNGGPAAPPAYPAAYPGVLGVTAIDAAGAVAVDAQRGPQVAFAAAGVGVPAAQLGGGVEAESGTSFAAPRVAAYAALAVPGRELTPGAADAALAALKAGAVDLGAPGRDDIYGYGALGFAPAVP